MTVPKNTRASRSQQAQPVIERCGSERLPDVLELLDACKLPIDDISLERQSIITAREGERLIGCCAFELHGPIAQLRSFAIRPDERSFTLARRLVGQVIREANQNGARTLILLTDTLPDAVLRRFYFEKRDWKDFDTQLAGARGRELSRGSDAALYVRESRRD